MNSVEMLSEVYLEFLSMMLLMNLFSPVYIQRRGRFFSVLTVSALVSAAVEYAALHLAARYILSYGVLVLLCAILFRRKIWQVFFEFLFSFAALTGSKFLIGWMYTSFFPGPLNYWERMLHLAILLACCLGLLRKHGMLIALRAFYEKYQQILYPVMFNIFAAFLIDLFVWDPNNRTVSENLQVLGLFMILWLFMNVYLLKVLIAHNRNKSAMQAYKKYEEMAEGLLDNLHAEKHEFNRHLQAVLRMCESEEPRDAVEKIEEYILEVRKKGDEDRKRAVSVNTGDGLINGLIYAKIQDAKEMGIPLACTAVTGIPQYPCLKYELVEILENLLDNSLEYLSAQPDTQKREIHLQLGRDRDAAFIKIRNNFQGNELSPEEFTQKGRTTKAGQRRGYGLYNVKRIVTKYRGRLNIFAKDGFLNIEIYFNMPEEVSCP